jgi:desampylase
MATRCTISSSTLAAIGAHAAAEHPREACGLLFGRAGQIEDAAPCANVADAPDRRFEIDPAALFAALRADRAGGRRLIGCYHSHPSGAALPSSADAQAAAPDGKLWLIVARHDVTLWRAVADGAAHGRFERVDLLAEG